MRTHQNYDIALGQSLANALAELVGKRDYAAAIKQYEAQRPLLVDLCPAAAGNVYFQAARAYLASNDLPTALKTGRLAQAAAAKDGDTILLADVCVTLGNILRDLGQFKEAETSYRDAESIFRRNDNLEGQSRALNGLAGMLFRRTDYRNALNVLMDAVEIARRLDDKKKLAFMMGNIGRIYTFIGELAEAEKHLLINIDLSAELHDELDLSRANLSLAYVYLQMADYAKAEKALQTAYPGIIASQSKRDEVIYLSYLGELNYQLGQLDEARRMLELALVEAEKIGPETTLAARVMRHLGEVYLRVRNERMAQKFVSHSWVIFEKANDRVELGSLLRLKAQIAHLAGKAEDARRLFSQAMEQLEDGGARYEFAQTLTAAGDCESFGIRQRVNYLFRAEEAYARFGLPTYLEKIARKIDALAGIELIANTHPKRATAGVQTSDYITSCPDINRFKAQLPLFAKSDLAILITGETGVGKDHLARYFHSVVRPDGPYVAINCASVPESLLESELFGFAKGAFTGADSAKIGLFVAANGGVLLLDEIGDMPLALQAKLLAVLERRRVLPLGATNEIDLDIKLVAATNCDLEKMVEEGEVPTRPLLPAERHCVSIPPLRERREDIPLLVNYFLQQAGLLAEGELPAGALVRQFMDYDWPGNVRELANKIKRLEVMTQLVSDGKLEEVARTIFAGTTVPADGNFFDRVEKFERQLITERSLAAHGNKSEAARLLGVHEATVRMKLKRYGIAAPVGAPN